MAGLVLKLGPKERVLINGAVLENGARRSRFSIITPSAHVLRLKDAIHPDHANTPLGRVCYQLQLILAGSSDPELVSEQIAGQISELARILTDPICQEHLSIARRSVVQGKFYNAMKSLKALLPVERNLLAHPWS
ncbi:MAG: flagellar biosynthesis repressor FlbT [Planktotalea sp.]|uniref:flagellar biosynthesis repressor FlbT n=1 Tax=Planktotalea sp. TaxID=2029877 RepID=UPI003C73DFFD